MTERRYTEEEVAAIFERATEAQATGKSPAVTGHGLSLEELQSVGAEVGIPGELVARAARSLDAGGRPTRRSFMGFPIGVGRTVELERRLTDQLARDWDSTVFLAVIGAGLFGVGALRLPGWAATRLAQMDGVASRLAAVTSSTAESPPSADS